MGGAITSFITKDMFDPAQTEKNLNVDPTQETPKIDTNLQGGNQTPMMTPSRTPAAGGKIVGWKEKLAKLREAKEAQMQQNEGRLDRSTLSSSQNTSEYEKVSDIFAPTSGLERGKDGKIQVDKEKVEEKKVVEFEVKKTNLVQEELQNQKNLKSSVISTASSQSTPAKKEPRMTLMERQAKEAADKKLAMEEKKDEPKAAVGGLKGPSRLAKPTATALRAQEDMKAKLLEKQQTINARMAEKLKASTTVKPEVDGTPPKTSAARSRLGATRGAGEEAKAPVSRLGAGRKSIGGIAAVGGIASRLGASGRTSTRPSVDKDGEATKEAGRPATSSRIRGSSKEKSDLQFGRSRRDAPAKEEENKKPAPARASSREKTDLKFGTGAGTARERSSASKERTVIGLSFNKEKAAAAAAPLDPSMTTIKKTELSKL